MLQFKDINVFLLLDLQVTYNADDYNGYLADVSYKGKQKHQPPKRTYKPPPVPVHDPLPIKPHEPVYTEFPPIYEPEYLPPVFNPQKIKD